MRFPIRAYPHNIPMVPAGPHRSGPSIDGGNPDHAPVWFSIIAAALLFVSSPWTPGRCHNWTVCSGYHPGALERGEEGIRLHFWLGCHPPQGGGDTVSRVWALSLPGTTKGRRLAGGPRGLGP